MILPTKHTPETITLLGLGATVLDNLKTPRTINDVWTLIRKKEDSVSYCYFILALDFLYIIGAIEYENGRITRCSNDKSG